VDCPFCSAQVTDARGLATHFRHQSATHPDYRQWSEDQRWEGKVEGTDYVVCLECGTRAATLARHLKAVHGITADQYREKHVPVLIRALKVTEKRQVAIKRGRHESTAYVGTKVVVCPSCGREHEVHKMSSVVPCSSCRGAEEDAKWAGLSDPDDYVTCLECGHRAENLTSHLQHEHPGYRERNPDAHVVALKSAVRDKSALQGRVLSDDTRRKMSENAGRWNKGLTKHDHPSLARAAEKMQARPPWSKGLTAEDPRIAETVRKLRLYVGENRPWDNGKAANLTLEDFKPFMDAEGRVDHHEAMAATGVSWVTLRKYIVDLGVAQTRKYIELGAEERTVRLDKERLEQFKLGNGKVSIGKAMSVTGHAFNTIKRECERHGLPTFHRHIRQTICMDTVSAALGGLPYEMEWESMRFTNPPTGRRFRFDGYFPGIGLVVEFHGHQHYTFPNAYMTDESYLPEYEALRERDRIKRERIESAPDLTYFEVREDEPYDNPMYLKGRLVERGLDP